MTFFPAPRRTARDLLIPFALALLSAGAYSCGKGEKAAGPEGREAGSGAPAASPTAKTGPVTPATVPPVGGRVTLRIGATSGLLDARSVAVDKAGNIWVGDTGHQRIVRFDASGREVQKVGRQGTEAGSFSNVGRVAASPDGSVAVLDPWSQFVQYFDADGKYLRRVGGPSTGFYSPGGLAVTGEGAPLVADTGNNRIVTPGEPGTAPVFTAASFGDVALRQPTEVAVDGAGNYLVLDLGGAGGKGRLLKASPAGALLGEWVVLSIPTTRDTPRIAVLPDGRIAMTDPVALRVVLFSADLSKGGPVRLEGELAAPLKAPAGIAADSQGRLYVLDAAASVVYRIEIPAAGP